MTCFASMDAALGPPGRHCGGWQPAALRAKPRRLAPAMALLLACLAAPRPCRAESGLATAPVDYSLYREGEVQRQERRFGGWLLTCDEIRRLRQKFCSLRSVARAADGTIVAALTVSTDDRGRPAALITLPFGTSLGAGMRIGSLDGPRGGGTILKPTILKPTILKPTQCGGLGCEVVWPLAGDDVGRLRAGHALRLDFRRSAVPPAFPSLAPASATTLTSIEGIVAAEGFADALAASMR